MSSESRLLDLLIRVRRDHGLSLMLFLAFLIILIAFLLFPLKPTEFGYPQVDRVLKLIVSLLPIFILVLLFILSIITVYAHKGGIEVFSVNEQSFEALKHEVETMVKKGRKPLFKAMTLVPEDHHDYIDARNDNGGVEEIRGEGFSDYCDRLTLEGKMHQEIIWGLKERSDYEKLKVLLDKIKDKESLHGAPLGFDISVIFGVDDVWPILFSFSSLEGYNASVGFYLHGKSERLYIEAKYRQRREFDALEKVWSRAWRNTMALQTIYRSRAEGASGIDQAVYHDFLDKRDKLPRNSLPIARRIWDRIRASAESAHLTMPSNSLVFGSSASGELKGDLDFVLYYNNMDSLEIIQQGWLGWLEDHFRTEACGLRISGILVKRPVNNEFTIDVCFDSHLHLEKRDPVSVIDIASNRRVPIFGSTDPYDGLGLMPSERRDLKMQRIFVSEAYLKRYRQKIYQFSQVDVISKQLQHSVLHFLDMDVWEYQDIRPRLGTELPGFLSSADALEVMRKNSALYSVDEAWRIFEAFTAQVKQKLPS